MADTKQCSATGKFKPTVRDFYSTQSMLYEHDKKLPMSKEVVDKYFKKLLKNYNNDRRLAFIHLCMVLDMYYDEETYLKCVEKYGNNFLGNYTRIMNRDKAFKGLTSLDNMLTYDGVTNIITGETVTSSEIVNFWGKGFQDDEYELLQRKYEQYTDNYPSKAIQEVNLIKTICMLEVLRERAIVKNDQKAFENLTNQISKRMEELNVLPSKMSKYGEDDNLSYGTLIAKVEKNEPIPDVHQEYDDVDRIKWWLNRYFLNPIKKLINNDSTPYTEEDEKGYGE
jgi:hypothetical protein